MNKQIRPIAAYKKANPERYSLIFRFRGETGGSKKDQENYFYYNYAFICSGIQAKIDQKPSPEQQELIDGLVSGGISEDNAIKLVLEMRPDLENIAVFNPFFYDITGEQLKYTNKTIITELGRLLLAGWYYGIVDKTKEICGYVYKSYQLKKEQFNEYEFSHAVKYIRENLIYFYRKPDELKFYILETFFNDQLQPLLPEQPQELKIYNEITELIKGDQACNLKRDKNHYIKRTYTLEGYAEYLQDILIQNGINYVEEKEYEEWIIAENTAYCEKIARIENEYKDLFRKELSEAARKILLT